MGFIPRGLPRIRHTGESRYKENQTGFRVEHGMTVKDIKRRSAACCGVVHRSGRRSSFICPLKKDGDGIPEATDNLRRITDDE
jgi:hypothetical protein